MLPTETRRRIAARLHDLHARCLVEPPGKVDRYYRSGLGYYPPDEAADERHAFAISVVTLDGVTHEVGDTDERFPLHSISKVFSYGMALHDHGREHVHTRVGVEPSGDAFNSLRFDERHRRPFNPMINAGALVTTSLIAGDDPDAKLGRILASLRGFAGHDGLDVDPATLAAELRDSDGNRGAAYLMRGLGMLEGRVEDIVRLYLQQCSVLVTSGELALMAATFANGGVNPITGQRVLARREVRDVLSVMLTCGMYDYAGSWVFDVGVPAKSGVGGGIMAVIPGKMGIAVYSPGLDVYGNSVRGVRVCREISERLGLHMFATEDEDALLTTASPGTLLPPPPVEGPLPDPLPPTTAD